MSRRTEPLEKRLTPAEEIFAQAVLTERSIGKAYAAAYSKPNRSASGNAWAYTRGSELASRPHVAARIRELRALAAQSAMVEVVDIMREWLDIARADPNELISYQRRCCRHCWGKGGAYQWKNEAEFAEAMADALDHNARRKERKQTERELPSRAGGFGFNHTRQPVVNCPACFGEGVPHVHVADTTKLSGPAAKLYAGVKVGKNGQVEVLMRDQDAALANLAKAMGMFAGKEPTDPDKAADPQQFLNELQKLLPN